MGLLGVNDPALLSILRRFRSIPENLAACAMAADVSFAETTVCSPLDVLEFHLIADQNVVGLIGTVIKNHNGQDLGDAAYSVVRALTKCPA